MLPVPPALSDDPVEFDDLEARVVLREAEAYWFDFEFQPPERRAAAYEGLGQAEEWFTTDGDAKKWFFGVDVETLAFRTRSLVRYLLDSGKWSAERQPSEKVRRMLQIRGIITGE